MIRYTISNESYKTLAEDLTTKQVIEFATGISSDFHYQYVISEYDEYDELGEQIYLDEWLDQQVL